MFEVLLMLHRSQFTLTTIFLATLLIAILLGFYRYWFVVLLVSEISFVFLGVELLLRQLPAAVKKSVADNCKRADRSWSVNREKSERQAVRKLRSEVWFVFLIVLVPLNLLVWFTIQGEQYQQFGLGLTIIWLGIASVIVRSGYICFVRQFVTELKLRSQDYLLRDIQSARTAPDFKARTNVRSRKSAMESVSSG